MNKEVAYYRVSTKRQSDSGLGLEGQPCKVEQFCLADHTLVEYTNFESGKNNHVALV